MLILIGISHSKPFIVWEITGTQNHIIFYLWNSLQAVFLPQISTGHCWVSRSSQKCAGKLKCGILGIMEEPTEIKSALLPEEKHISGVCYFMIKKFQSLSYVVLQRGRVFPNLVSVREQTQIIPWTNPTDSHNYVAVDCSNNFFTSWDTRNEIALCWQVSYQLSVEKKDGRNVSGLPSWVHLCTI